MIDRVCDLCRTVQADDASVCSNCGHNTFSAVRGLSTCPRCGEKRESEAQECPKCKVPLRSNTEITRHGTGLNLSSGHVFLTTGQEIPGRDVDRILGLLFAAGNAAWTLEGTSNKSNTAMGKASSNLMSQALELGADAVIAIQMSIDGSGSAVNRSQTVTLFGTAVKLVPIQE